MIENGKLTEKTVHDYAKYNDAKTIVGNMAREIIDYRESLKDVLYLCQCAEHHADKFPVPEHIHSLVARIRSAFGESEK